MLISESVIVENAVILMILSLACEATRLLRCSRVHLSSAGSWSWIRLLQISPFLSFFYCFSCRHPCKANQWYCVLHCSWSTQQRKLSVSPLLPSRPARPWTGCVELIPLAPAAQERQSRSSTVSPLLSDPRCQMPEAIVSSSPRSLLWPVVQTQVPPLQHVIQLTVFEILGQKNVDLYLLHLCGYVTFPSPLDTYPTHF